MKIHLIKIYTTTIFSLAFLYSYSQANTVGTGGDATGTGGSFSYTIGQIDYINTDSGSHNKNEGVQQPYEFYNVLGIEEYNIINRIYPNPTTDLVYVETAKVGLNYELVNSEGKVVWSKKVNEKEFIIDFSTLAPAAYILDVYDKNNQSVETIKIIKK